MIRLFLILLITLASKIAFASEVEEFWLSPESLMQEAQKSSPTSENIRSALIGAKFNKNEYLENFESKLEGDVSYYETNDVPFIVFAPTVSPVTNLSVGVTKDFTTGMSAGVYNVYQKNNYGPAFGTDAKNSLVLEFTADLYKDFFGRESKSKISHFEHEEQIANIQKDIDQEIFLIGLYRVYLSLVFNQEAINVSREILENYKQQEKEALKRYKNGISDLSEVKRRASQVASKRVDIFNLVNKKENLILELKQLLPSISNKEVGLSEYKVDDYEKYFSSIVNDIRVKKETPLEYTSYDDLVRLSEKSYADQKKFSNNYGDMDLEFYSKYVHSGRDDEYKTSLDNAYERPDEGYQIGLRLSAPIGGVKIKSEKLQLARQNANFLAKKRENLAKIDAFHGQSLKNLKLLRKAEIYQLKNSKDLKQILSLSQKKYNQARIPIRDLITDQELYLQSLLREIDIKLVIINQILNYMTIFTNTPFSLSKNG